MSTTHRLLRFGVFELNLDTEELRKDGLPMKLGPQPFKVLAILTSRSGQIVPREEIRREVWGEETYVDFEHGLNQCIKQIRTALNDNSSRPLYVETLPRKGYRFLAPVTSKTVTVTPKVTASTSGVQPRAVLPMSPADGNARSAAVAMSPVHLEAAALPRVQEGEDAVAAERAAPQASPRGRLRQYVGWLAVPVLAAIGIGFYWHSQKASALTDRDTIVLADFTNNTTDPVFDDTLKTALGVALNQSPFLNVLPDNKVAAILTLMTQRKGVRLTPELARDVCLRANSKAYVAGSIAKLGNQYVVQLRAVTCQTGDPLAEEQATAESKEKVLNALGSAAAKLRRELGESLATVQKFDVPLSQATTSSLEALKSFTLAARTSRAKGFQEGLPYAQRAIELDPDFAMAYYQVGGFYFDLGEAARAKEYFAKALQLRDHASEREKLIIGGAYYQATSELDKAAQTYQEMIDDYPRDHIGYQNLSLVYGSLGEYDKAVELAKQAASLSSTGIGREDNLINFLLASQQFEQARMVIKEALEQKVDSYFTHAAIYGLSFIAADSSAMAEQLQWFASIPAIENFGLSLESDTEAYAGHLANARELTGKAVDSAVRADNPEEAATWWENEALREAAFGNLGAAQQAAAAGLTLAPKSLGVQAAAGLAYAISRNSKQAESLVQQLNANYPLNTQVQSLGIPAIQAQLALNLKNPTEALNQLGHAVPPLEYGSSPSIMQITCLYPTYIRGQAYLESGQASAAAAEFQKILDHRGMVWNCWTGALAHLGLARAYALEANHSQAADAAHTRALAAYTDFLGSWKDADGDIPLYQQAQAEYANLKEGASN